MSSDIPKGPERRWYDTISNMTMALHLSKQLPTEIRQVIATHLNQAIDEHRKHHRTDKSTSSLGPSRTLSLYKAGRRQRWYDTEPSLHRALTMMIGMPHPYLSEFASRILGVGQYWTAQTQYTTYYPEQHLMNDAVESILRSDPTMLNQTDDGIRLVLGYQDFSHPEQQSHSVMPIRRHRPQR